MSETAATPRAPRWTFLVLVIAFALIGISYWNAPKNGFVYDDQWQIVRNPLIQQSGLWKTALTSDVWAFKSASNAGVSNYYRPVFTAWSIANYAVFEQSPMYWHIANIALHAYALYLLLMLLVRLRVPPVVAAVVTWIFAAHPAHVESVTWIAGSPDLLMTIFLAFAALRYLDFRERGGWRDLALALVAMALAMGSKESSMMFVIVIAVAEFAFSRQEAKPAPGSRCLRAAAPFALVALAFFLIRFRVTHQFGISPQNPVGMSAVLTSLPQTMAFYLKQALAPLSYSSAYPLRTVLPDSLSVSSFFGPLAICVAAIAALVWMARRSPERAIGFAFLTLLAPSLYIRAFHPEHIVRDRYLYLPLFGLFLIIVGFIASRTKEDLQEFSWSPLAIVGLGASLFLAYQSQAYNPVWENDETLWKRGVETDPNGSMAFANYAEALRQNNKTSDAIDAATKAVELNPTLARPHTILGTAYKDAGNQGMAEKELRTAIDCGIDTNIAAGQLADLYRSQGRFDEAVSVFEDEMKRQPDYRPVGAINVAVLRTLQGKRDLAKRALLDIEPELKTLMTPDVQIGWFYLGQLESDAGHAAEAKGYMETFLRNTAGMNDPKIARLRAQASEIAGTSR